MASKNEDDNIFIPFPNQSTKYKEIVLTPKSGSKYSSEHFKYPWLTKQTINCEESLVRFHNEILEFCQFVYPVQTEMDRRSKIIKDLTSIVKELWPSCELHVYGSHYTHILTSASDIDICILSVPTKETNTSETHELECLHQLAHTLKHSGTVSYCEVISNAKVPIVKIDDKETGISIDININNDSGLFTGDFVLQAIREFPAIRPLTVVLKIFLAQRGLNDTYSGGIGSFVLTCMVISLLQMREKMAQLTHFRPAMNLGVLLVDFFNLYGGSFNLYHTGIRLSDGGSYFRKREAIGDWFNISRPNLLSIENPFYPDQDMGRNSFQITKIRRSFEHSQQILTCVVNDPYAVSYLSYIIRANHATIIEPYENYLASQASNALTLKRIESPKATKRHTRFDLHMDDKGDANDHAKGDVGVLDEVYRRERYTKDNLFVVDTITLVEHAAMSAEFIQQRTQKWTAPSVSRIQDTYQTQDRLPKPSKTGKKKRKRNQHLQAGENTNIGAKEVGNVDQVEGDVPEADDASNGALTMRIRRKKKKKFQAADPANNRISEPFGV